MKEHLSPLRIAGAYAIFGALWILLSDTALHALVQDAELENSLQTVKGWFFIIVTGGLVYWLTSQMAKVLKEKIVERERIKGEFLESEKRQRDILNNTSSVIYMRDLEGRFLLINRMFEKLFNVSGQEIVGKTVNDIFPQVIADAFTTNDLKVIEAGTVLEFEEIAPHDDGEHTYISVKFPLKDVSGKIYAICGISTDITARKKAEEALHQSEKNLRTFIDNAPALVSLKSLAGKYIMMNIEYTKRFGLDPQSDVGKSTKNLFTSELAKLFELQEKEVIENKVSVIQEHIIPHTDGDHFHLCTKFPVMNASGEVHAIGTISTDITDSKEAERRASEAMEEAQLANLAKTNFLAHMSHELRTPLNSIIGFSQTITEEVYGKIGNDKYLGYLEDIHNSGYHLLHLINDILDLSKIEAGELTIEEDDVDIDEVLNFCLRMIQGKQETKSVSIQYDPTDNIPHILADERLVKQIVLNLLSNAVKYNVPDGTVCLSASLDQTDAMTVVISDTGVGIVAEDIPKVLEPFMQARSHAHMAHEGTGLGLSLSKQLAELHGGTLELESQIGKGTTVTVKFSPERTISA